MMLFSRPKLGSLALGLTILTACHAEPDVTAARAVNGASPADARIEAATKAAGGQLERAAKAANVQQLRWGSDVTLRRRGYEVVAAGPNAVALDAQGHAFILDRLASRVLRVDRDGKTRVLATVPMDAEDLSAASDGSFLAFSPVRATAWLFDAHGRTAGDMKVPRVFRELLGLEFGPSNSIQLSTAYQERIALGSPSAPHPLPVAMHSKREGVAELPDGRSLITRVDKGHAQLQLLAPQHQDQSRSQVVAQHPIAGPATAARIVGVFERTVCLRLEHVQSHPEIAVQRRAICLDGPSGHVLLDERLKEPGLYLPRRELAVGGGWLAHIHAHETGLELRRWPLSRKEVNRP